MCDRVGDQPQNNAVRSAACPEFRALRGKPRRRETAILLISGRQELVEAADQGVPISHTADMRSESKRRAHFNQWIPTFERVSEEQRSTPRPAHASGMRSSLAERRQESGARSVSSLRVRDRPSRFLRHETLEKARKCLDYPPNDRANGRPEPP